MERVERKSGTFLKPAFTLFMVSSLGYVKYALNQFFAAKISVEYLKAFSMLAFLGLGFYIAGTAIGEVLTVVINLDFRKHIARRYIGGGVFLFLSFSVLTLILMLSFENTISAALLVENLKCRHYAYLIWLFCSFFNGLSTIAFFSYSILEMRNRIFLITSIAYALNIIMNIVIFHFALDDSTRFLFLSGSNLISSTLILLINIYDLADIVQIRLKNLYNFISRGKGMLAGETASLTAIFALPLLFSRALDYVYGGESVAAYNVAIGIADILLSLAWSIQLSGVTWLSENWLFSGTPEWSHCLRTIKFAAIGFVGLPTGIFIFGSSFMLRVFFNLHSVSSLAITTGVFVSIIPALISSDYGCLIKVLEKQHVKATTDIILTYGLGLSFIYLFGRYFSVWHGIFASIVLSSIVSSGWLILYGRSLNHKLVEAAPKAKTT